jgi:hypothetical protein
LRITRKQRQSPSKFGAEIWSSLADSIPSGENLISTPLKVLIPNVMGPPIAKNSPGAALISWAETVPTLAEWFRDGSFRGCAFINSVGELGGTLSEVVKIGRRHKQEMTTVIASLLPASRQRKQDAQAIALAVDGAIVRAQFDETPDVALKALARLLKSIRPRTIRK